MNIYISVLFALTLFITLLGFNINSASAYGLDYPPGCTATSNFSTTTGQACSAGSSIIGCNPGDLFSSTTGQACGSTSQNNSSAVAQFNVLFKSNFTIGLRGSNDVRALQQFLKDQGYYYGRVDGSYGRITARAVKDFQGDYDVTGTVLVNNHSKIVNQTLSPVISYLSQTSGPVGTQVTMYGSGFGFNGCSTSPCKTNSAMMLNTVHFGEHATISNLISSNGGTTLTFTVPSSNDRPICPINGVCLPLAISPNVYTVFVANDNGTSNSVNFTVTSGTVSGSPVISGVSGPQSLNTY